MPARLILGVRRIDRVGAGLELHGGDRLRLREHRLHAAIDLGLNLARIGAGRLDPERDANAVGRHRPARLLRQVDLGARGVGRARGECHGERRNADIPRQSARASMRDPSSRTHR